MRFQAVSKTHYFIKFDVLYVGLPHKLSNPRHKKYNEYEYRPEQEGEHGVVHRVQGESK